MLIPAYQKPPAMRIIFVLMLAQLLLALSCNKHASTVEVKDLPPAFIHKHRPGKVLPDASYADSVTYSGDSLEKRHVLLHNKASLLPLKRLDTLRMASLAIGAVQQMPFQRQMQAYKAHESYTVAGTALSRHKADLQKHVSSKNLLILYWHQADTTYTRQLVQHLSHLCAGKKLVVAVSGPLYAVDILRRQLKPDATIYLKHPDALGQRQAAQLIFGGMAAKGQLTPEQLSQTGYGQTIEQSKAGRLAYGQVQNNQLKEGYPQKIDSLIAQGIRDSAFPGCQLLAAHKGRVVYHKAFGFHTYDSLREVHRHHMYDLASVTKISGPLPALMQLRDSGLIRLDVPLKQYWNDFGHRGKDTLSLRQVLAHQARLQPWLPFWKDTRRPNGRKRWFTFSNDFSCSICIRFFNREKS